MCEGPAGMTIQDRIVAYLSEHSEGVDDDALAAALNLRQRQQANQRCRRLEQYGFVSRRTVNGKIRNFLDPNRPQTLAPRPTPIPINDEPPWYWEGHVQDKLASHLQRLGYTIEFLADTANKTAGKGHRGGQPIRSDALGFRKGLSQRHGENESEYSI